MCGLYMEDFCQMHGTPLLGGSDVKTILFPGYFSVLNQEYTKLIKDIKGSFEKVHLIIGLINDRCNGQGVCINTVAESISKIPEVDQVLILDSKPSVENLKAMNLDFVATLDPNDFKDFGKTLQLKNTEGLQDKESIKDFENSIENIISSTENSKLARLSSITRGISVSCKKKLKKIKKSIWKSPFNYSILENAIEKSRKYLQQTFTDWGERRERILRNWMNKCKVSAAVLVKLLREVWEHA